MRTNIKAKTLGAASSLSGLVQIATPVIKTITLRATVLHMGAKVITELKMQRNEMSGEVHLEIPILRFEE